MDEDLRLVIDSEVNFSGSFRIRTDTTHDHPVYVAVEGRRNCIQYQRGGTGTAVNRSIGTYYGKSTAHVDLPLVCGSAGNPGVYYKEGIIIFTDCLVNRLGNYFSFLINVKRCN